MEIDKILRAVENAIGELDVEIHQAVDLSTAEVYDAELARISRMFQHTVGTNSDFLEKARKTKFSGLTDEEVKLSIYSTLETLTNILIIQDQLELPN